jgi:hypothetical protein
VRKQSHLEAGWRLVEVKGAAEFEADTVGETRGQCIAGFADRLDARVDRENGARSWSVAEGKPTIAATDLENARALELADRPKGRRLGSFSIDKVSLKSHGPRSPSLALPFGGYVSRYIAVKGGAFFPGVVCATSSPELIGRRVEHRVGHLERR